MNLTFAPKDNSVPPQALFGSTIIRAGINPQFRLTSARLTIDRAREMIQLYQDDTSPGKPIFIEERGLRQVNAFAIEAEVLDEIKAQFPNYTGIRLYLAINGFTPSRKPVYSLIVVPKGPEHVNDKDENILQDGFLYDWVEPCPDNCPDTGTKLP